MALFNVSVLATLNIPREVREILRSIAESEARVATTLDAILAKLTEDPDPVIVGEIQVGDAVEQPTQGA